MISKIKRLITKCLVNFDLSDFEIEVGEVDKFNYIISFKKDKELEFVIYLGNRYEVKVCFAQIFLDKLKSQMTLDDLDRLRTEIDLVDFLKFSNKLEFSIMKEILFYKEYLYSTFLELLEGN